MTEIAQVFIAESRRLLSAGYVPKIERSMAGLTDDDIWWRPNEASNSIGNLVLHLCGNVNQWMLGGVGNQPLERERQREFDQRTAIPGTALLARLREVVAQADDVLARVTADELGQRRNIQDRDVTVVSAIYHVIEHFSMHTGQIIYIAKLRGARDLGLWTQARGD